MTLSPINYSQFTPNATKRPVQDTPAPAVNLKDQQTTNVNLSMSASVHALVLFSRQ